MNPARRDSNGASAWTDLTSRRLPGHNLPREFFVDPSVHDRDVDRFFLGHWVVAGHAASIPREGDYFLYDIGFESIVIARGEQDAVHASLNVCRHRGSRVAIEEYGHCRNFVCPMDGWTYGLDGKLQSAPNMPVDFDKASHGLTAACVEVVDGVIFFCMDTPADFTPLRSDLHSFIAPFNLATTRIAYHRRYLCPANWKLVVATFLEWQAGRGAYPQMHQVLANANPATQEFCSAIFIRQDDIDYSCRRESLCPGFATQSEDGESVAPQLGSQPASAGNVAILRVLASWIILCSDYAAIVRMTPLEAQVTEMDVTWLVRDSAIEGVDYDAPRLSWFWKANVERALKLASDNQLGVNSTRYQPGPFALDETELEAWYSWYLTRFA